MLSEPISRLDFAHGMLDRHARFGADDQQVDHIRIGAVHRLLALLRLVAEEDFRRLDADDRRAAIAIATFMIGDWFELRDEEHIDQREQEEHDRRDEAEGQERVFGDWRRGSRPGRAAALAVSVLSQFVRLNVSTICLLMPPAVMRKLRFVAADCAAGEPLALAHADPLALGADGLDASVEIVVLQERQQRHA